MTYRPSLKFSPDPKTLAQQVASEVKEIARSLNVKDRLSLPILYAVPDKPRNGEIVYADGTSWDPGSGAGFYGYEGGAWVKL